ncbi:MAG TPA: hypothetical protein VNP92_00105 [Actinophytocola sp.]|nr:hypothetical protein [Actinophytocola sp.]
MNITAKLRARRVESRNRRAVNRAVANAATPAMRDELLIMAQRQVSSFR